MYGWLWSQLPGPAVAKLAISLVLIASIVAFLWFAVFPIAEGMLPFTDVTVDSGAALTPGP